NRYRFLGEFPNRIGNVGNGEPHSLTVADWSPEIDISQDDHGYLLKADLPEMKKEDVRVTVEDGILCVSGERKTEKEDQKRKFHRIERALAISDGASTRRKMAIAPKWPRRSAME